MWFCSIDISSGGGTRRNSPERYAYYHNTVVSLKLFGNFFRSILLVQFVIWCILIQAKPAHPNVKWNNYYDRPVSVECNLNNGEALFRVRSSFSGHHRDRRWKWDCHKVANKPLTDCSWTHHINTWGGPINKQCKQNYVLSGIKVS